MILLSQLRTGDTVILTYQNGKKLRSKFLRTMSDPVGAYFSTESGKERVIEFSVLSSEVLAEWVKIEYA